MDAEYEVNLVKEDPDFLEFNLDLTDPFEATVAQMVKVNRVKRADYSSNGPWGNFFEAGNQINDSPGKAVEVHISTKQSRLKNLMFSGRLPKNESIADTILDRAVYSTIALAMYNDIGDKYILSPREIQVRDIDRLQEALEKTYIRKEELLKKAAEESEIAILNELTILREGKQYKRYPKGWDFTKNYGYVDNQWSLALLVDCPACYREVGQSCVNKKSTPATFLKSPHKTRLAAARIYIGWA